MNILAVESSCDETAVAIVRDGRQILCDCIASQVELHRIYGGVVPEIASRKHMEAIYALADQALAQTGLTRQQIDAVAVTYAPGLIGAVLVGVNFAKAAALDKAAQQGDDTKYALPVAKPGENPYNMSFSGLKTATLNLIHHAEQVGEELDIPSLCAAFTAAVSETLTPRVVRALEQTGRRKLAVAGGVAANSRIRADILKAAEKLGAEVYLPPLSLCGDNAAMIGAQAYYEYQAGNLADMSLNAYATKSILGEAL